MTFTAVFETEAEMLEALWIAKEEGAKIIGYGKEATGWWTIQYEG